MAWLQVFALPGLELLVCQELQDGLTFPWAWKPEQAQLIRAAAVAQDGQLAMVRGQHSHIRAFCFSHACDSLQEAARGN